MKVAILSVIYYEPEWTQTCADVANYCPTIPTYFVDREGVGGLAAAFNRGFQSHALARFQYVWFLTNIRFGMGALAGLLGQMDALKFAAIHPAFKSDHPHIKPIAGLDATVSAPFVEFTAPLVRSSVFARIPLDEKMPYAGHDLDWGRKVRDQGHHIGVYHGVTVNHIYIRHSKSKHPITVKRAQLRAAQEKATNALLHQRYGDNWFQELRTLQIIPAL